jgi:hypothetical protein
MKTWMHRIRATEFDGPEFIVPPITSAAYSLVGGGAIQASNPFPWVDMVVSIRWRERPHNPRLEHPDACRYG